MSQIPLAPDGTAQNFSLLRNIKVGLFHVGSSMADILALGVWNRIVIGELGLPATPIALLLALRYFLAPLSIWIGRRSDVSGWRGYRRTPYIWGGRLLIVLSYMLLGFSTVGIANSPGSFTGWAGIVIALIAFSIGSTLSGTVFLALIYDIVPERQRTRAVSVVWFFLIAGFPIAGSLYSRMMPTFTPESLLQLFIIAPLIMGSLWLFSLWGEEKPVQQTPLPAAQPSEVQARPFWLELRDTWANGQTRVFFLFLALSTLFFYTQDAVLEPFGKQVFEMAPRATNLFSSFWGTTTLIGIVVGLLLTRRFPTQFNNTTLSRGGIGILIVTFAIFSIAALARIQPLVYVGLIVLGCGLGAWTVGSLGLMMDMTFAHGAGLYLSLWTVSETLARGAGTIVGGVVRDLALAVSGQYSVAYGTVFVVQTVGFILTYWILTRVNVTSFRRAPSMQKVAEAAMD